MFSFIFWNSNAWFRIWHSVKKVFAYYGVGFEVSAVSSRGKTNELGQTHVYISLDHHIEMHSSQTLFG